MCTNDSLSRSNYYFKPTRRSVHNYSTCPDLPSSYNKHSNLFFLRMASKTRQRCRVAWLEPIDAEESPALSPLHLEDIFILDSLNTYSWIALAGVFWALVLTALGVGRPALFAVVAGVHCAVIGLVAGFAAISARIWPSVEAEDNLKGGT